MLATLMLSAFLMGLAGSPHCLLMCGGLSAAAVQSCGGPGERPHLALHLGRLAGYAGLGGLAGGSLSLFGTLAVTSPALRPLWTLLHAAALLLGLYLLLRGAQPRVLEDAAHRLWRSLRPSSAVPAAGLSRKQGSGSQVIALHLPALQAPGLETTTHTPPMAQAADRRPSAFLLGTLWALLPCGLLYSALMLAALTGTPLTAAAVMLAFGAGTATVFALGQPLLAALASHTALRSRLPARWNADGKLAVRAAGLLMAGLSASALVMLSLGRAITGWCA